MGLFDETIFGCVDFSDGSITFEQLGCEYPACMIWEGNHAGQVAVTIDNDDCNDIYYGCIDWSTGKFEVVVPDDCCCKDCNGICDECTGKTGDMILTFAGMEDCFFDCEIFPPEPFNLLNVASSAIALSPFTLSFISDTCNGCFYRYQDTERDDLGAFEGDTFGDCFTPISFNKISVTASILFILGEPKISIAGTVSNPGHPDTVITATFFRYSGPIIGSGISCVEGTYNNDQAECEDTAESVGGTCQVSEGFSCS